MWKDAFSKLMSSKSLVDDLVANSQKFIADSFSDKALSVQVFNLLQELVRN